MLSKTELVPNRSVISAYRRNCNLADLLVRAKLPMLGGPGRPPSLQPQFTKLKYAKNSKDKTIVKIKQEFTTRTQNLVYLIFCSKCGFKYVGETRNSLSTRMVQHFYNVRNHKKVDTPLVKHFLSHGLRSMRVAGLEKNQSWTDAARKKRERLWIYRLSTREPWGLNIGR